MLDNDRYGEVKENIADAGDSGNAMELEDMQEEVDLRSPDWIPSATAEETSQESLVGTNELRPRCEVRLQYSGTGPRTPRIAGEISDRMLLAKHIAKKTTQRAAAVDAAAREQESRSDTSSAAAVLAERKERLAMHLYDMTGLSEVERVRDVVRSIIEGERVADAVAFAGLHKYLKQFSDAPPEAGRVQELREMMTLVQRELLENRRDKLLPLLVQHEDRTIVNDGEGIDLTRLSLTQIVNQAIEEYVMDAVSNAIWDCLRAAQSAEDNAATEAKRASLRQKPQDFFGIEGSNASPSGWAEAIAELNLMQSAVLPTNKLRALLRAKDAVLKTFTRGAHATLVRTFKCCCCIN